MTKFLLVTAISAAAVLLAFLLPHGTFADISSLPAHPLIVHGVVVLLPLIALILLAGIFKRKFFAKYHLHLIVITGLINTAVIAAKSSGESLSAAVGLPEKHAEWGNNLVPVAMALFGSLIVYSFFTLHRRTNLLSRFASYILIAASIASIALTIVVGHSGAESVWKSKYANAVAQKSTSNDLYTVDEVSTHNSQNDCWTIVNKKVYNVTSFVYRHPAGSEAIREMCGKNASEDFLSEHSGQAEPEKWLASLKIGYIK